MMTALPSEASRDAPRYPWLRFNRHEFAGAFGDLGTDLPLLLAIIPAAGMSTAGVFITFGTLQILTGLRYGLPMPMQPLKAMAVLVIAQQIPGEVLRGGGLAIGLLMLLLALSGLLNWLVKVIPLCVVRGIQLGLGLKLAQLSLGNYLPADGWQGYALGAASFVILIALRGSKRLPPALIVLALGALYALLPAALGGAASIDWSAGWGLRAPPLGAPSAAAIWEGFLLLALAQLPLSLSNSVIATHQTARDLFPERAPSVRSIGGSYAAANLIAPFTGGVPVCHGCGGLAGHYAFGGRTGGSVVIYGSMFLLVGLFLSGAATTVMSVFPTPVLGVILLVEAWVLMQFVRDVASDREPFAIALLVGLIAAFVPQGFLVGMVVGTVLAYSRSRPDKSSAPA